MQPPKPVIAWNDEIEIRFSSLYEAAEQGYDKKSIRRAIKHGIKHKDLFWKFAED